MTDRELMQEALSVLVQAVPSGWSNDSTTRFFGLIDALRIRLAQPEPKPYPDDFIDALRYHTAISEQPEQEPVAWMYNGNLHEFDPSDWAEGEVTPLYTAPPQREWQGLTDEGA